jgi:hypothetical protein
MSHIHRLPRTPFTQEIARFESGWGYSLDRHCSGRLGPSRRLLLFAALANRGSAVEAMACAIVLVASGLAKAAAAPGWAGAWIRLIASATGMLR